MRSIELAPFCGSYKGLGIPSCDSVVGLVQTSKTRESYILKWNKKHISSEAQALGTCRFLSKTIHLCEVALGKDFLVPTKIVEGEKKDGDIIKYKVYTVQPFIEGWTAKNAPMEARKKVEDQWNLLNSRLFNLYNTVYFINRKVGQNPSAVFPITLTVGSSRKQALTGTPGGQMPLTPNLLISKDDFRLYLCDFGDYLIWQKTMESTYNQIIERVQRT